MNIEIAGFGKMSQTGSSLLKIIQNNDLPILDLFVREAVQNSLDAALLQSPKKSVMVDIGVRDIDVNQLAPHFEGISTELINRFSSSPQKMLYIEDKHTVGLTGPRNYQDISIKDAGNIFKLIYGVSMPQTKEGAGGSWGLGKTIYFRIGVGLVIYYSRVLLGDGTYENRLAATLVENEESDEAIIPKEGAWSRGIAWWGETVNDSSTIPINNDSEIAQILKALSTELYTGTETGTKIIIPFIDEKSLVYQPELNDEYNFYEGWSASEYIKLALQKWYAPRLDNQAYPFGKWLDGRVNGERILKGEMRPFYLELQLLYNAAADIDDNQIEEMLKPINNEVQNIELHRTFKQTKIGKIAFKKYTRAELKMDNPDNQPSPFTLIGKQDIGDGYNSPIVFYTRKPGMIVNYEITGEWCHGIKRTTNDEFILAAFVPSSEIELKEPIDDIVNLEGYLRKSEKADHTSWFDLNFKSKKYTIVSRIQKSARQAIANCYEDQKKEQEVRDNNILSRRFGKMLLPQVGYGQRAGGSAGGGKGPTKIGNKSESQLRVLNHQFLDDGTVQLDFELNLSPKVEQVTLELVVESESGKVRSKDWEDVEGIGTAFPLELVNCTFLEIETECENVPAEFLESNYAVNYGMLLQKTKKSLNAKGHVIVAAADSFIQFSLDLKIGGSKD